MEEIILTAAGSFLFGFYIYGFLKSEGLKQKMKNVNHDDIEL